MKLNFSENSYEVKTLTLQEETLVYRAFEHIPYVDNPKDEKMQCLSLYVPEAFYHGQTINGYDLYSAPIFMPNSVGGYMPGPETAPGYDFMGRVNAVFKALMHGYIAVSAGVRGRGLLDASGRNIGVAPAGIVDLKAAVRFLREFKDSIPGDTEHIITNGTSAGGAMSSLQGCTGNHPDYLPYLNELGAADQRDDVFASSCYCPITNLDHADMAYEWEFNGIEEYHRVIYKEPLPGESIPQKINEDGIMSEQQNMISAQLKHLFPFYLDSLMLKDENGVSLSLNAKGINTFQARIEENILLSAQEALESGNAINEDPAIASWLLIENGQAVDMDWNGFIKYRTRMKTAPAFDDVDIHTPENELFGSPSVQFRHFTSFSQNSDPQHGPIAEGTQVRMMNPMEYIDDPKAIKAKHFRIRHGAIDRDTSLAISNILQIKLMNAGIDAEVKHPWGVPHSGDYDLPQLFEWIDSICR